MVKRALLLIAALSISPVCNAVIIFESATPPTTTGLGGGTSLTSQYLGTRFELTETTAVTAVGGHMNNFAGTLFAAIVPLVSATALPTSLDIEAIALASTLFTGTFTSSVVTVDLHSILEAGVYGLVFGGADAFGATGHGAMPASPTTGSVDLPGTSYFFRTSDGATWVNGGFANAYFFVEGEPIVVPGPGTLGLLVIGLLCLAGVRRVSARPTAA